MTAPRLEAHYTNGSKTRSPRVAFALTVAGRREWLNSADVAGKAAARKLAVERGATPWNF